jgi:hypothetical protein
MRNNNYNDNHILTPTERLFYQRMAMEGTKRIIDECWKLIKDEKDEEAERKITALHPARDCNVQATKHRQLFVV